MDDDDKRTESRRPPAADWRDNSGFTSLELYPNGEYKSFVPEIDTEWMLQGQAVKLRATFTVKLFPEGGLEQCVLAAKTTLNVFGVSASVAEGAKLAFHPSGELRSLTLAPQGRWFHRDKRWKYRGEAYDAGTTIELSEDGAVVRADRM